MHGPILREAYNWRNADPIRRIFKESFLAADLPSHNPHSFRDSLTSIGFKRCKTPEEFKAWSKNLGHESVLTTLANYGDIQPERQAEIIRNLGGAQNPSASSDTELISLLIEKLKQKDSY